MEDLSPIIQALNSLSPLGLAGGLGYIIYLQVKTNKGQNKIATNHLHGLPEMHETLKRIEENQKSQTELLYDIKLAQKSLERRK